MPASEDLNPPTAQALSRGVCRLLTDLGYAPLCEFKLTSKRRVDVIGLDGGGKFLVVEIKSSVSDFRSDSKWRQYLDYGDAFYFAVGNDFPRQILPADCGIIVADSFGAAIARQAPANPMNGSRRKAQIQRFANTAAARLHRQLDPAL